MKFFLFLSLFSLTLLSCHHKEKRNTDTGNLKDSTSFGKSLALLNIRINAEPQNADLYYQRARIYLENKNFGGAQADINRAVYLDSSKADYFVVKGDVLFANYKLKDAAETFEKVLHMDPQNTQANLKLAEMYLYLKAYPKVFEYCDAALKIDPHTAKAYFIKGFAFMESKDTSSAISSFQTVVEQEPQNFDAYMRLGILMQAKHNKLALQYYNNALRLKPKDVLAWYDRSFCYQEIGDFNKAIEGYYTILKIDSNYADAHYNLGYIHLVYLKVYDQAIKHFTDAIRVKPDYYEAWYNRGLCYENVGNIAAAKENYEEALRLKPDYSIAMKGLERVKK